MNKKFAYFLSCMIFHLISFAGSCQEFNEQDFNLQESNQNPSQELRRDDLGEFFNPRPWVYFDLGNTLIDVNDEQAYKWMPGALVYLQELKRLGLRIGLITNIPESFGQNFEEKYQSLKKLIQDHWSEEVPFDWDLFDKVIIPLSDSERKPAPILFSLAFKHAHPCGAIFNSENAAEVAASRKLGLGGHLIAPQLGSTYLPTSNIRKFIDDNFHGSSDIRCWESWPF